MRRQSEVETASFLSVFYQSYGIEEAKGEAVPCRIGL